MTLTRPQMIASIVKEGRIAKGYTQKELAEISNISIRSIQRIENAQLQPRAYTLKVLADVLNVSFAGEENIEESEADREEIEIKPVSNKTQRIIVSAGISLVSLLLFWAFMAQSPFPETTFELLIGTAVFLLLLTLALWYVWKPAKI